MAYHKVLGTKNPADILTKYVPAELLKRHLATLGTAAIGGRAEAAPELHDDDNGCNQRMGRPIERSRTRRQAGKICNKGASKTDTRGKPRAKV